MYSMPQHAVTNGYWKMEYFRAQPRASSSFEVKKPPTPTRSLPLRSSLLPLEASLAPDVGEPEHENRNEGQHLHEPKPAQLAVEHGPRPHEEQLDVDENEEDGHRGELDGESPLGDRDGILAALEGLGLDRTEAPRRDERGNAEQGPGHQRGEGEHHEDGRVLGHAVTRSAAPEAWRLAWYELRTRGPASTWANPSLRPTRASSANSSGW